MICHNYREKKTLKIFLLLLSCMIGISITTSAQTPTITGPTCVTAGSTYGYIIGNGGSGFTYSVTNGFLQPGNTCCGTYMGSSTTISVKWNTGITSGSITATVGGAGSTTLNVTATTALSGGALSNTSQNIITGSIPATINSSSAASGGYCTPNYAYQWQSSPNNVTYTNITGATTLSLSFTSGLTQTTYYRRMVTETNTSGTAYSNSAAVYVYPPVVPGSVSPTTQTINYGANASVLTVSGVSGGNNSYTYQWQSSADASNFANVSGATATTYTPTALTTTTYYRIAVTSSGQTAYTNYVTVNVNPQLLPGIISPALINITSGTSPGIINGTAASYGSCGTGYAYQWYSSTNGTTFTLISSATAQNYTPGNLTVNTWFTRKVTCSSVSLYSDTAEAVIVSGTPDINYVRVRDITKAGVLDSAAATALTSGYDVAQTTQYFDGLGRQLQTVAMQQSPLQKDLVSFNVYDPLGREAYKFLPYVATTTDGNYKPTAQADDYTFNNTQFTGEQYYYGQTAYEPSPLNRVSTTYAPGSSWVGAARGVSAQYALNTTADSVRYWKIAFPPGSLPTTTATYAAGKLYKNVTTDEAGHSVVEYKDMEGKVVLKKVQLAASPGT
ncbi:MAG: DUF6443 domain-containing protein, partial [Ginsengibacter sp.]